MANPPKRPIKRLLIANRGEIATRILHTAQEMSIETYTLHTTNDTSHALSSTNSILLPSPSSYLSIPTLIRIAQTHHIDVIHPGYGFLSESAEFAHRMLTEANTVVIGPGPNVLARTGDKLQARRLAEECGVPVLPALQTPTNDIAILRAFANEIGYPMIIKAVDGGGGRGIRIVRREEDLASLAKLALNESPSGMAFAEKAAVDGFRHVEVQILGDGTGEIMHLWERECSIQRRFQKVVEFAPSSIVDRGLVGRVIESAMRMARQVGYLGLGTWEFLVREDGGGEGHGEFYFLEINPRIQVEHTVTESIVPSVDLVKCQLLLAQGVLLSELPIPRDILLSNSYTNANSKYSVNIASPPQLHSIQLRLTAEDASNSFALSVGKITSLRFPTGHGVRIDTHLVPPSLSPSSPPILIGADFDPLLAKIIVVAPSWREVVAKARRALNEMRVEGVKTDLDLLRGVVASREFAVERACDTRWLETNLGAILEVGRSLSGEVGKRGVVMPRTEDRASKLGMGNANGNLSLRKGDKWTIELTPGYESGPKSGKLRIGQDAGNEGETRRSHLQLTQVRRNDFPNSFSASILYTSPSSSKAVPYTLNLHSSNSTSASTSNSSSRHKPADPTNQSHQNVNFPMAGKLVEILVQKGDIVREGDTLAVVRQMKMELEVRVPKGGGGKVVWVCGGAEYGEGEGEEGEDEEDESDEACEVSRELGDIEEGMLCCVLESLEKERKGGGAKL